MDNFMAGWGITMTDESEKNLKIRFRFPGGEEFEAEGSREFIEQQRNYFLALIGKGATAPVSAMPAPRKRPTYPLTDGVRSAPIQPRTVPATKPTQAFTEPHTPQPAPIPPLSAIPPAMRSSNTTPNMPQNRGNAEIMAPVRLWEQLLKEDGEIVVLRRKMRLSAAEAASLLVAGARVLLKKPTYSALNLSQSMRKSGFDEGRLDRILTPEIRNGHLESAGAKRSRTYRLTNEGFAKAFVLAEKLARELL